MACCLVQITTKRKKNRIFTNMTLERSNETFLNGNNVAKADDE